MTDGITSKEVRGFLQQFASAIEMDQARARFMRPHSYTSACSDHTWQIWRRDHLAFIGRLLATADMMSSVILKQIDQIASSQAPREIGHALLELFAEVVSGSVSEEDFGTAEQFFAAAMALFVTQQSENRRCYNAQRSIKQWVPFIDPLGITKDPEYNSRPTHIQLAALARALPCGPKSIWDS